MLASPWIRILATSFRAFFCAVSGSILGSVLRAVFEIRQMLTSRSHQLMTSRFRRAVCRTCSWGRNESALWFSKPACLNGTTTGVASGPKCHVSWFDVSRNPCLTSRYNHANSFALEACHCFDIIIVISSMCNLVPSAFLPRLLIHHCPSVHTAT